VSDRQRVTAVLDKTHLYKDRRHNTLAKSWVRIIHMSRKAYITTEFQTTGVHYTRGALYLKFYSILFVGPSVSLLFISLLVCVLDLSHKMC